MLNTENGYSRTEPYLYRSAKYTGNIEADSNHRESGVMVEYYCHECDQPFFAEVENDYGTYEFRRCPQCGSAKTTLT